MAALGLVGGSMPSPGWQAQSRRKHRDGQVNQGSPGRRTGYAGPDTDLQAWPPRSVGPRRLSACAKVSSPCWSDCL